MTGLYFLELQNLGNFVEDHQLPEKLLAGAAALLALVELAPVHNRFETATELSRIVKNCS